MSSDATVPRLAALVRPSDSPEPSARVIDRSDADIVVGPREQLFHLIAEASEIEHTLMCSYLYAALSLKRSGEDRLSERESAAVERWRKVILAVATEEMVHLLLMANMAIALGGRPHFSRPNFPVAPGYFPSGVMVKLTPFSPETLDHFIYLERPQGIERPDGEGFEHEQDYRREQPYAGLMPSVQDYATVGRLYEALRLNLVASAQRMGEAALFVGPVAGQIGPDALRLDGVATIGDLASALRAIATIVEQGEGSSADREDSHYQRFRAIKAEYAALQAANRSFQPAWPAAHNPVMRRPPEPEDKVFIDHPTSARVLDFANAVYGTLLRLLVQAFGRFDQREHSPRNELLDAAIELMHLLAQAAAALVRLPASALRNDVSAGMTFTMLRGVEPLVAGPAERTLMVERLHELAAAAGRLERLSPLLANMQSRILAIAENFSAQTR